LTRDHASLAGEPRVFQFEACKFPRRCTLKDQNGNHSRTACGRVGKYHRAFLSNAESSRNTNPSAAHDPNYLPASISDNAFEQQYIRGRAFGIRLNPGQTLSTPLYTYETSIEFTTRLARLLARKTGKPVYVGNSISFASAGMGGTVEEEMEGFKKVVEVVMKEARKSGQLVNGH
ncbi:hypothetical protein D0Z07_6325, partial [Hyphodiscus hymeniophilus]